MCRDFEGKYAVITGASSGMGADSARLLAQRGLAGLVIVARNEERAKAVAAECEAAGCKTYVSICDVSKVEDVQNTLAYIKEVLPQVDILVNAAGYSPYNAPWDTESVEHFNYVLDINFRSQFLFCQALLPGMVERKYGKVVNFSSCTARAGSGLSVSYSASKAAIANATKTWARAVGPHGVNVNAVLPGVIRTPMLGDADYSQQEKAWPLRRCGQSMEVAEMVAFLASDRASYMAGALVDVNGGYVFS